MAINITGKLYATTEEGIVCEAGQVEGLDAELSKKQDKLTAGNGIEITNKGVINVTLASELAKVALTNDYNDLDNKPIVGDIPVFDYEELPIASEKYMKQLARYDHKLYEVIYTDGWDFNPIEFGKKYSNISSGVPKTQLQEWWMTGLRLQQNIVELTFFDGCNIVSTNNTIGRGIQIGSNSNTGVLSMAIGYNDFGFKFRKVTITLQQYNNETSHTIIELGRNSDDYGYETLVSETVNFEYEGQEEVVLKETTITLETENEDIFANQLDILTEVINEGDRGCIVIKELIFNDLQYFVNEGSPWNRVFNLRYDWKPISGDTDVGIKVIDLLDNDN